MLQKLFEQFDSIIFLDVETSGLSFKTDEIIEFGCLRVISRGGELCCDREVSMLVQLSNGRLLPPRITELTGITFADLKENGVSKETLVKELTGLFSLGKPLVVAYNAQFDLCFLYWLLSSFSAAACLKNIKMLDALTVYKDRRDYPHKLENAVEAYALETKSTHRAIDDAAATYELLCAMDEECPDLDRYINLFGFNPKYGVSGPKIGSVTYVPQSYYDDKKIYELG